jgi:hypothetical protein
MRRRARSRHAPRKHDEAIESIPGLSKIGALAEDAHGRHLDAHLNGEEGEDEVIGGLQPDAASRVAFACHLAGRVLFARLIHAECDAIEYDDEHADPFKPRAGYQTEALQARRARLLQAVENLLDKAGKRQVVVVGLVEMVRTRQVRENVRGRAFVNKSFGFVAEHVDVDGRQRTIHMVVSAVRARDQTALVHDRAMLVAARSQ